MSFQLLISLPGVDSEYPGGQTSISADSHEICRERLAALRADGYVERVHRGLYALG
jgi:hypothetical protein